jgi:coenzyme F420-reducing hydrogenase gamma subunit
MSTMTELFCILVVAVVFVAAVEVVVVEGRVEYTRPAPDWDAEYDKEEVIEEVVEEESEVVGVGSCSCCCLTESRF